MKVDIFHPETAELFIEDSHRCHPLDPGVACPAGNNRSQRKTVFDGQHFSVHFVCEKRGGMKSFLHWDRALEVRHRAGRGIRAIEKNLERSLLHARATKHIGEPNSAPS